MLPTPIDERLPALHMHYTRQINAAVAAGRMDLVQELADGYADEALELMVALEGDTSSQPDSETVEILECGGWPQWRRADRPGTWRSRFGRHNRG